MSNVLPSESLFFSYQPKVTLKVEDRVSKAADGSDRNVARFVAIVSAAGRDLQGEDIDQDGIDWSYFMKSGVFNWEHQAGPDNILGYPVDGTLCRTVDADGNVATQVTGELLLDKKKAYETWETMTALQKAGNRRQVGFSIEGPVVQRDPRDSKKILKAWVKAVAITAHPIRDTARVLMLAKSMDALHQMVKGEVGYQTPASGMPDGGAASALLGQSIDRKLADRTTYGLKAWKKAVKRKWPAMDEGTAEKVAKAFKNDWDARLKVQGT